MARARKQPPQSAETEPPARRSHAASVSIDIAILARAAFLRAGFDDPTLVLRWREIAGPEVARIARPLRITQGASGAVLTLKADPAAALFLQHESRTLCARINTYLGRAAVQSLRFVPGEIALQSKKLPQKNPQDSGAADPALRFAGENSLKRALLALARARRQT
ncbi:MAG TPA: DUF721 domain-containing protein [Rhizomicrobium sp.]|nr:DUF721 domain-containing protein [Rhizomicrobium sp.]